MFTIYLGILAVGIIAIVVILINEKKNSKSSVNDLMDSLHIDESPGEEQKTPGKISSSVFLTRLNLDNGAQPAKESGKNDSKEQVKGPEPDKTI